jgi:hypothetical protein
MRSREWFQSNTSTTRAHQQLSKVTSFYSQTHAINSNNWLLFECCFALLVTFVGLMEGEGTLKSCKTDLRKYDHMAHSKYNRLHLPPLDEDIPSIDTPAAPTVEHIQGPITRARAKQFNY